MKILVLDNDLMERKLIQQVLWEDRNEIIPAADSDTAMQLLQEGEIRFVIADRITTDIEEKQFIRRVREANPPFHIYVLILTPDVQESDLPLPRNGADDYLHKPMLPLELRSRIHIGQRILGLGDHLTQTQGTLQSSALFDSLTNVLNYKAFLLLSRGELERARRTQSPLSLIALGIDNFQAIHDQFGELISADVLAVVAQGIREKSRPYDDAGRYEADIFLIILPGVIGPDAERIIERIIKGILNTEISLLDGTKVDVKLSAGIACSVHITAATEVDALIEKAVEALQQAKRDADDSAVTVFV